VEGEVDGEMEGAMTWIVTRQERTWSRVVLAAAVSACLSSVGHAQTTQPAGEKPAMGFFVTSRGIGRGADLGGLAGADRHCQELAASAGAGGRTWRAYVSQTSGGGAQAIHARDRIGSGPWYNARGTLIASSVADLHGDIHRDRNAISKLDALDEQGREVKGRGDTPNEHDILTGSDSHGRALLGRPDVTTCNNWTSSTTGHAMVGHHDRVGGGNTSWNAVHLSAGCSQEQLVSTGGAGLLYCFAVD
jgi:hypothetical protein